MGSKSLLIRLIDLWTGPITKKFVLVITWFVGLLQINCPRKILNSLGEGYYRTIQIFRGQFIRNSPNKPCNY